MTGTASLARTAGRVLHSRALLVVGVLVALAVPAFTLPSLPHVTVWPMVVGSLPWIVGEYILCALRWRSVTTRFEKAPAGHLWYLRANAEAELLGLLTPGHVGADVWRIKRLTHEGVARGDSLLSAGTDRVIGVIGCAAFVVFAARDLPLRHAAVAGGIGAGLVLAALIGRRLRSRLLPGGALPCARVLLGALLMAAAYQLTIVCMLLGTLHATGHSLAPMSLLAAFGASQAAGAIPGPNGASPKDGALVVALVALGIPLAAAAAAVALKAALAWIPAFALGGVPLLLRRPVAPAAA
jgi:hypothetical protein